MSSIRPRVLYLQYTNPSAYPPLEHSARLLVEAGCDVALLGTASQGDPLRFHQDPRIEVVLVPRSPGSWRQKIHYARFAAWVLWWARRWKPTWVYVSDPLAAPIGLALRRILGVRVIYHEHDSPDATAPGQSAFMRTVFVARRALARRADVCVLPSESRAEIFAADTNASCIATVWNCPMRHEVVDQRVGSSTSSLRVLYHGSIVPARLPMTVLDAIAEVPGVSLDIVGYETAGHDRYVEALQARARAFGIDDRVVYAGTLPSRDALMAHAATFDVGLALLPSDTTDLNERHMVGASNKPFDYLANGLALLVGDLPDWIEAYVEPGFARSCRPASADSIAEALRWFLQHPEARLEMGERGRQRILAAWNYERAFASVLDQMAVAWGRTASRPIHPAYSPVSPDARGR